MDIDIINDKNEPLLNRKYFEGKIVFEGKTPSRIDLKKDLCKKLNSKDELTVISKISTDYGSGRALLSGYVYNDAESMKNLVEKYVLLRHLTKAEQQAEKEKAKAAKQAAAPTSGKKK